MATTAGILSRHLPGLLRQGQDAVVDKVGGPARARVIFVLAAVLSVDSADKGTVGALAPQLEAAFHIGNLDIGLLVAISSLIGAVVALPMGVLADRVSRTRLLYISVIVWAVTEAVSAFSTSYLMLLLTRIALGGVTATAGPAVGSLTGDFFPATDRGRVYGYILTGDLLGAGGGLLISGDIGSAVNWRVGFLILTLPTLALAWIIHRHLPEPARGGQSRIPHGGDEIISAREAADGADPAADGADAAADGEDPPNGAEDVPSHDSAVLDEVRSRDIEADPRAVVKDDPSEMGLWDAVRWVFRVRTNLLLIISTCLGYFFFSGLKTFAVLFARGRYGISESTATLLAVVVGVAAIGGIILGGQLADRRLTQGHICSRLTVGAVGFLAAAVILVPAFLSGRLAIALPLILIGAFAVSMPNSPGDAARLDVVPSRLWGRTEAIRTFVRTMLEAFAPLLFGFLSEVLGSGTKPSFGAGVNNKAAHVSAAAAQGLAYTFLIMLAPLAAAGLLLLRARRTYPTDVASAAESEEHMSSQVAEGTAA